MSDPAAQIRLLNAFTGGNTVLGRSAHTVLGPDTDTRRMLSLLRSTSLPRGHVCVAQAMPKDPPRGGNVALYIVQHPLGAQDFIGRHDGYTATREETRL